MFKFFKKRLFTVAQQIEMAKYPVVMAPLFGSLIPVQLRKLTAAQIRSCGNISLLKSWEDKAREQAGAFSKKEIIAFSERHKEIAKKAMVCPTYDELFAALTTKEKKGEIETQIKELEALIAQCDRGPKKQSFEEELDSLRIWYDLILPSDFVSYIVGYSLGINESDIQIVSDEMLIDAAYLAERGHDNPSDHLPGQFTDFMRDDINMRAWFLLDQKKKELRSNAG
jgi:hypothetical protein